MKNNFYNISNLGNFMNQVSFAVDGISLFFVVLSTFLIPLCILTIFKINFKKAKEFCFYFLILEIFLILSFTSTDIISFFIYFESILIPMFLIIGI
jgi:NADH-quinone oxidoreductase subunit M